MKERQGAGGLYVRIDEDKVGLALDALGNIPSYDDLVPQSQSLTTENILSVKGEHGKWYAVEFDYTFPSSDEHVTAEVGVAFTWTSDGHPLDGYGPTYIASLLIGTPAHPDARWPVDNIDKVVSVAIPTTNPDTGEDIDENGEAGKLVYAKLVEELERLKG